jgi:hypothetical protein
MTKMLFVLTVFVVFFVPAPVFCEQEDNSKKYQEAEGVYTLNFEKGIKLVSMACLGSVNSEGKYVPFEEPMVRQIMYVILEDPDKKKSPFIFSTSHVEEVEPLRKCFVFRVNFDKIKKTFLVKGLDKDGKLQYQHVIKIPQVKNDSSVPKESPNEKVPDKKKEQKKPASPARPTETDVV